MVRLLVLMLALPVMLSNVGCLEPRDGGMDKTYSEDKSSEFRGIWVTRFEWANPDPDVCRSKIADILRDIADHHFNAVVFQVRGAAETLYPSKLEPWSPLLEEQDPGFDPLAFAVEQAHANGLEFHAYVNPMPLRSKRWEKTPADPSHLYYAHGPDSEEPWICMDSKGNVNESDYYYLSAGVPGVHVYLREVLLDLVSRYDIDGIHYDRIRGPGAEYNRNPVCDARYHGRGNPNRLDRSDWQREQLDKLVNDLAAEIWAVKPNMIISSATWGIYNKYHIPGYEGFSSGYHDYYQDSWSWCQMGAMDVLMPMIYWDLGGRKPDYDELLLDFNKGVGADHVVGGQNVFRQEGENIREIEVTREAGSLGTVLFSYSGARRHGVLDACKNEVYQEKVSTPGIARIQHPETGCVLGRVLDEAGNPLVDAWVSIAPLDGQDGDVFKRTWVTSADGRFAFVKVPPGQVDIHVRYPGASPVVYGPVSVEVHSVTSADIEMKDAVPAREEPFLLTVIRPEQGKETESETVHLLGRTQAGCTAKVNGNPVTVYSTGAFAADNIPLEMGENILAVEATNADGRTVSRAVVVTRIESQEETPSSSAAAPVALLRYPQGQYRVARSIKESTGIVTGTHSVRLGGPYLAEVPSGTKMVIAGEKGNAYWVRLSQSQYGYVARDDVELLEQGTSLPENYFTSIHISGDDQKDVIRLTLGENVVYSIDSETEPNRLYLNLYNSFWASTWNSHMKSAQVVGPVTGEQVEDGLVRLTIPVNTHHLWGYWAERNGKQLTLTVRHAPEIGTAAPLHGLTVAVEAGHGNHNNGAVGLMGTKEKDVNRAAVDALIVALMQHGAQIVDVRPKDTNPTLQERVQRANESQADLFVSVHANAAGTGRGYLRVSGTSTYFCDVQNYLPAKCVYDKLIELDWPEFGVVGDFQYVPCRNTHMPAILVEQAFMSHIGDEARLLDPEYLRNQAEAIVNGLEQFLLIAREPDEN